MATISLPSLSQFTPQDKTFGVMLMGTYMSLILYGMSMHRSFQYFRKYRTDPYAFRLVMGTTIVLETTHILLYCYISYQYLFVNRFYPTSLLFQSLTLKLLLGLSTVIVAFSQSFVAWRASQGGSRNKLLLIVLTTLVIGKWAFLPRSAMSVIVDLLLTYTLLFILHSGSQGAYTHSPADFWSLLAVNCGLLASVSDTTSFLSLVVESKDIILVAGAIILAKLHANVLVVTLSNRPSMPGEIKLADDNAVSPGSEKAFFAASLN